MKRKKILLVTPGSLFPVLMASQDRGLKMALRLAQDHQVDLASVVTNSTELEHSKEYLEGRINGFFPLISLNYNLPKYRRKILGLGWLWRYLLFGLSSRRFYWGHRKIRRQLENVIFRGKYDIVQLEGWYLGEQLRAIPSSIYKAIDTQDVLYEQKMRAYKQLYGERLPYLRNREMAEDKRKEIATVQAADLIISVSEHDFETFKELAPKSSHILIPCGRDLRYYHSYPGRSDSGSPTVLFYGSLSSQQNSEAFFRLYDKIFPIIKKRIPDIRLLIVGADPPKEILRMSGKENIEVTGFVEDVRPAIARASLMVLPMSIAAGFRSRVVEVMAMGVPVLGTHNALDSIGLTNGREGYVEDDDELLAGKAIELLENGPLLKAMGAAAKGFVERKFNLEETYGRLAEYYANL